MADFIVVLFKLSVMFLVMAMGWMARSRRYISTETTQAVSRLVVDLVFPAMVFTQMLKTVSPQVLRDEWYIPVLGAGLIGIAVGVGYAVMAVFQRTGTRGTAVFLIAMPNWIFFPLPIVEGLYGASGVRSILLCNIGAQLALWTVGISTLGGMAPGRLFFKSLLRNNGLMATVAGIGLALLIPLLQTVEAAPLKELSAGWIAVKSLIQALSMLGSLTIPLALLLTGAQLGELPLAGHRPSMDFCGVMLGRLLIAPVVTVVAILALGRVGFSLPEVPRMSAYIIAFMPVAISCSMVTERYRGDVMLSARSIFYTTLCSVITVPVLYYAVRELGL